MEHPIRTSILEHIDTLPPFPESIQKLEKAFQSGEPDMKEIMSIIESDPLLTANILAKANSPANGLRSRIISVMQAVTLFGLGTVRAFALRAAMEKNIDVDVSAYGISNDTFARISSVQNALMFQWFMGIDVEKAKTLIPLAFLMEIGKVLIANEIAEHGQSEAFMDALASKRPIEECEREWAGITSGSVAAHLFRHWHFDETFVELMDKIEMTERVPGEIAMMIGALRAVRSAVSVAGLLRDEGIESGRQTVDEMGLDGGRFVTVAQRIRDKQE